MINLTIDFICRNMDEAFHTKLDSAFDHDMSTLDIGLGKLKRVAETEINMGLCCEMKDCVDLVILDASHHLFDVRDVPVLEYKVRCIVEDA